MRVYDRLIKAKRYDDAAQARPRAKMEQEFDRMTQATVKNIEVLAG